MYVERDSVQLAMFSIVKYFFLISYAEEYGSNLLKSMRVLLRQFLADHIVYHLGVI